MPGAVMLTQPDKHLYRDDTDDVIGIANSKLPSTGPTRV